jgi:Na+/H+ antiporter NhaA
LGPNPRSAIRAGVGFTISLFVSDLAIGSEQLIGFSKVGILACSALCAAVGYYVLQSALEVARKPHTAKEEGKH